MYWVTKDKQKIKIKDLTDSHLMNVIFLIERNYAKTIAFYLYGPQPRGEMACDAFDREFDQLDEGGPSYFHPSYDPLVEEAEKRGLDNIEQRNERNLNLELQVLNIGLKGNAKHTSHNS
jgi:hypothetical protein